MGRIEHPLLDGDKLPIRPKTAARNHTIPKKVTSISFLLHGLGHFWFRTSIFDSEWIFGSRPPPTLDICEYMCTLHIVMES